MPYNRSLHHSMSPKNTMTHPQSKSTLLLQCISPCLTSMTPPDGSQLTGGPDIFKNQTQSTKMDSLLQRMETRDPGPSPLLARGLPRMDIYYQFPWTITYYSVFHPLSTFGYSYATMPPFSPSLVYFLDISLVAIMALFPFRGL